VEPALDCCFRGGEGKKNMGGNELQSSMILAALVEFKGRCAHQVQIRGGFRAKQDGKGRPGAGSLPRKKHVSQHERRMPVWRGMETAEGDESERGRRGGDWGEAL